MKNLINGIVQGFPNAEISEDEDNFYIDLGTGLGEAEYPKSDWNLREAIKDQSDFTIE